MTAQNGRAFNEWLRAQLKAKKMSQRQLAQQSGVDHSTISRLIRGDRMPSLGTATKLARGLRELRDDADTPQYLGLVAAGATNPTARVEYALRADEMLTEPQVRQIMEYYLAVRMRRFGRAFQPGDGSGERGAERPVGGASAGPMRTGGMGATGTGATGAGSAVAPGTMHGITPRVGSVAAMRGTVRPMASPGRPVAGPGRPVAGPARSMTAPAGTVGSPRPLGRANGRLPDRD